MIYSRCQWHSLLYKRCRTLNHYNVTGVLKRFTNNNIVSLTVEQDCLIGDGLSAILTLATWLQLAAGKPLECSAAYQSQSLMTVPVRQLWWEYKCSIKQRVEQRVGGEGQTQKGSRRREDSQCLRMLPSAHTQVAAGQPRLIYQNSTQC